MASQPELPVDLTKVSTSPSVLAPDQRLSLELEKGRGLVMRGIASYHLRHATTQANMCWTISDLGTTMPSTMQHRNVWACDFAVWATKHGMCTPIMHVGTRQPMYVMSAEQVKRVSIMALQWNDDQYAPGMREDQLAAVVALAAGKNKPKGKGVSTTGPQKRSASKADGGAKKKPTVPKADGGAKKKPTVPRASTVQTVPTARVIDLGGAYGRTMEGAALWFIAHILVPSWDAKTKQHIQSLPDQIDHVDDLVTHAVGRVPIELAVCMMRAQSASTKHLGTVPALYRWVVTQLKKLVSGHMVITLTPVPPRVEDLATYETVLSSKTQNAPPGQFVGCTTHVINQKIPAKDRRLRVSFRSGFKMWAASVTKYSSVEKGVAALHDCLERDMKADPTMWRSVMVLWRENLSWYYGKVVAFDSATKMATIEYEDGETHAHALTVGASSMDTLCTLS